jgi:hypothetical protein
MFKHLHSSSASGNRACSAEGKRNHVMRKLTRADIFLQHSLKTEKPL